MTFNEIDELAGSCKYNDCTHTNEDGCAVLNAVEEGIIEEELLNNYLKVKREQMHYSSSIREKRQKQWLLRCTMIS